MMSGRRRQALLFAGAWVLGSVVVASAGAPPASGASAHASQKPDPCKRVVAMGDLHGGYDVFVRMLGQERLVDDSLNWISTDVCLVQNGDIVDRGADSRRLLKLVIALTRQAPDHVYPLLGNHEVMNVVGDLRYVFEDEYAAYAGDETEEDRKQGYEWFLAQEAKSTTEDEPPSEADLRERFDAEYPPGYFAHRRAFAKDGVFGKWLLTRPIMVKIGRSVFVHGGLSPADAEMGVAGINARAKRELEDYLRLRDQLVEGGVLGPLTPFGKNFLVVASALERRGKKKDDGRISGRVRSAAKKFLELRTASIFRGDGPLWNRDLANLDEATHFDAVLAVLASVDADRIVLGHTPQRDGRITVRFGGRVLLIDTGAGPYYGSHPSALEIEGDVVRAVYPGQDPVVLVDGPVDEAVESVAH